MLKMTEDLMRMGSVRKMGKQSYISESETNNLSTGKLWFCLFVIMKLEVSFFKFNFYFICVFWVFLQTIQAIRRTKQDNDEERAEMQSILVPTGVRQGPGYFTCALTQLCARCNQSFPRGSGLRFYCCKATLSQGLHLITAQGVI